MNKGMQHQQRGEVASLSSFLASPARLKIQKGSPRITRHSLSQTRLGARIDAIKPLTKNHGQLLKALEILKTDLYLPAETFSGAESLTKSMTSFDFVLLTTFWLKTLLCEQTFAICRSMEGNPNGSRFLG